MSERFENSSFLGMTGFRSESHVAQQSRRDKLRIPQPPPPPPISTQELQRLSSGLTSNPDVYRSFRNCDFLCDPAIFSSSSSSKVQNPNSFLSEKNAIMNQESNTRVLGSVPPSDGSFSHYVDPSNWNGVGVQQDCDLNSSFINGSSSTTCITSSKEVELISPPLYSKPSCNGEYQDSEISNQNPYGDTSFSASRLINFQSNLQEVVRPSTFGSQGFEVAASVDLDQKVRETVHESWVGHGGIGLVLGPRLGGGNFNGAVDGDSTTQSLSLSLSSHGPPPSELHSPDLYGRFGTESSQSRPGIYSSSQNLRTSYRVGGNSIESIGGSSSYASRCTGPLGPFTGYATILKNSKFLKPAQQLLSEFCNVAASARDARDTSVDHGVHENKDGRFDRHSGVSSSICSSKPFNEGKDSSEQNYQSGSFHPEFQKKKATFLYMLDEVCRRYKQYHQQIEMVISSFESVAGLNAATPYTSLALKTVSKHFRCLKNAITDQLRITRKATGEDISSPISGTSSNKGDATMTGLRLIDQNLGKQMDVGNCLGFLETDKQHVWRPQRGLPERAVSVLRAWLFEHFLHPYPSDTDKHNLATQTGLTRNQVSNWFINARVRIWKPMVEEMHQLEAKAKSEMDLNSGKTNMVDGSGEQFMIDAMSEKIQDYPMTSNVEIGQSSEQQLHQDKRSRMECHIPSEIDDSLMGFIPYHQSALEIGGLGPVSLTLGLRHSAEGLQQQQQQQLRRHFGGEMIYDFVG